MWWLLYITCTMLLPAANEVPVLCYHNIEADAVHAPSNVYISAAAFRRQMKALSDSGYQTPDPSVLLPGHTIPSKTVFITFDDSHASHFSTAAPILENFHFRGLFFVMTVTIGKKGYLTEDAIRLLHEHGHWIGSHTWDHPHVTGDRGIPDEAVQLYTSKATLERITGIPVYCFAYPYGIWNDTIVSQVRKAGYRLAFQLSGRQMSGTPQYTIRRIMADGRWSGPQLIQAMQKAFR